MSTNPLTSITTTLLDVKRLFEKMNRGDQDKFRTSAHKELVELEKLIDAIHAKCVAKEKEPIPCPHCDKKFMNLKLHITNSHTCDYCESEVADKYKHYDTCSQMIEQLTDLAKENGLTYVHSELSDYKVVAGNFYEWNDKTNTVGAYAGRLKGDGTLDKTAAETFAPEKVKEKNKDPEPCPHCDKKLMNLKNHILNIHTCGWCMNATVRDLAAHRRGCTDYIKARKQAAKEQGLVYIYSEDDDFKVQGTKVYAYDEDTRVIGAYVGRLRAHGTLDRDAAEEPVAPQKEKEKEKGSEPCPHCDKTLMNLESHITNIHTCTYCKDTTVRNMFAHHNICPPYLKWRESIRTTIPSASEKPICPYCSFCMNSGELVRHIEIAHTCSKCKEGKIKDLKEHMTTCGPDSAAAKKKKERIPAHIKTIVWRTYIGNEKPEAKCYCCKHETVDIRNFECGHVVAEAKGGPLTVDNLRPICRGCNGAMGTMSMEEYCQKFFGRSVLVATAAADDDVFGLFTEPLTSTRLVVDPFADLLG